MFDYRINDRMRVGGVTPLSVVAFDSTAPQMVREVEVFRGNRGGAGSRHAQEG